jgi:7-cyano-7-deazaguanine synthase in queuosine biosynthesis
MRQNTRHVFCNGIKAPARRNSGAPTPLQLEWRDDVSMPRNINLGLPRFIDALLHLPDRILDLLEIAAYVFAADRWTRRGAPDSLEYHGWARSFQFHIRVRDAEFWSATSVQNALRDSLLFMTGDKEYTFDFRPGHRTPAANLFDLAAVSLPIPEKVTVLLFSGGLDSLAGAAECLTSTDDHLCLVSHESQPGTIRTQRALADALEERFPKRIMRVPFSHSLHGLRAAEETQRSRSFLFASIAFAVSTALGRDRFQVCENGFTSLGLPERQDLMNARASRTTHPKTLWLLESLLSEIAEKPFTICTPYLWNTKADVFTKLRDCGCKQLISSSVSCSKTFQNLEQAAQCGGCSQCIERRFAAYAAKMEDVDSDCGIYAFDFIREQIEDGDVRTTAIDFVRLARDLATCNLDHFYDQRLGDLANIAEAFPGCRENEIVSKTWQLCQKHGNETMMAVQRMRLLHDDLCKKSVKGSLLDLVSQRAYLDTPVERLVERISDRLSTAIPLAFRTSQPKNEGVLNDQIEAILQGDRADFQREFPVVKFGLARAVPDHSVADEDLFIEGKYIRGGTSPSKVSSGIAEDLTKYPSTVHTLFVVYDPNRAIPDDAAFAAPFVRRGRCTVIAIR